MSAAALLIAMALGGAVPAAAPPGRPAPAALSLRLDNDIIAGTDKDYSSGFSLALSREGRGPLGGIWGWLGADGRRLVSSYELGHLIMTPADILAPIPDPSDRPYAGVLFGAVATQAVGDTRLDGLKVLIGVVGPASLAEPIQRAIHAVTLSDQAHGWDYQLRNEILVNAIYEHRRRYTLRSTAGGWGVQAIPRAGVSVGTLLVEAQAEAYFRVGRHLPDNFGPSPSRGLGNVPLPARRGAGGSGDDSGVHLFAGGGVFLVARNLTLDGNTFTDGPRVDKKHVVPSGEIGVSMRRRRIETTFSFVAWGREHAAQWRPCRYGSATLTWSF
jgi:hypothetical protein